MPKLRNAFKCSCNYNVTTNTCVDMYIRVVLQAIYRNEGVRERVYFVKGMCIHIWTITEVCARIRGPSDSQLNKAWQSHHDSQHYPPISNHGYIAIALHMNSSVRLVHLEMWFVRPRYIFPFIIVFLVGAFLCFVLLSNGMNLDGC